MMYPAGFVGVSEAVEMLGRSVHGALWTGRERIARKGLIDRKEWAHAQTPGSGLGMSGSCSAHGVFYRGGMKGVVQHADRGPQKASPDQWPYGDPDTKEYQDEREARQRYDEIVERLHGQLNAGARRAIAIDRRTGREKVLCIQSWRRRDALERLKKGSWPDDGGRFCDLAVSSEGLQIAAGAARSSASWDEIKEAAALKEFGSWIGKQSKRQRRDDAFAEMKKLFPTMPKRAFVQRIWPKSAPKDWKKPGHKK